jgi:hypothetical protein
MPAAEAATSGTFIRGEMKQLSLFLFAVVAVSIAPRASAQDHAEIGAFVDYFRWNQGNGSDTNLVGLGGRLSVNIMPVVQLEGEIAYDFSRAFTEGFTNTSTGAVTLVRTDVRLLHGMFGPKLQTNKGPVRLFLTVKGGAANFGFTSRPATFSTFTSSVQNLRASDLNAVFYPGGGAEGFFGPIGLRLDVGDEIYFSSGAHNNLRVTFGPTIRF